MADKTLVKRIEEVLNSSINLEPIARRIEQILNTEIPHTPRITGRQPGARVMYVALPGRGKARANLSQRAAQVLGFIERHTTATAKQLQKGLRVNRNVIAGAMHELRQRGLVRSEALLEGAQHAGEYRPREVRHRSTARPAHQAADRKRNTRRK